jgi:hypothetical protein
LILNSLQGAGILPFKVPNLFVKLTTKYPCDNFAAFVNADMDCNFLGNYGDQILVIACTVLFSGTVSILCRLIKRRCFKKTRDTQTNENKSKPKISMMLVEWTDNNWGILYPIVSIEGSQLEILCYIFIHFFSFDFSPAMMLGAVFSLLYFSYMITAEILRFKTCLSIWKQIEDKYPSVKEV